MVVEGVTGLERLPKITAFTAELAKWHVLPNSVPVNISFPMKEGFELCRMSDSELQLLVHGHVSFCYICCRSSHLWQRGRLENSEG